MKIEGASAATRARLAALMREGIRKIEALLDVTGSKPQGEGDAGESRALNRKDEATLRLRLLEEKKELILLEGDEGVSDVEAVRAENARLRREVALRDQMLMRCGVDVEAELGRLELLAHVSAPVVAAPAAEVEPAPPVPPTKTAPAPTKPRGKAGKAGGRPDVYEPRQNGIG